MHDKWLTRSACTSQGAKFEVDRFQLKSFWGLFVICGFACLLALCMYFILITRQFSRHYSEEPESFGRSSASGRVQTCLTFIDEKEEDVKSRSKRRQMERASNRSIVEDESTHGSYSSKRSMESNTIKGLDISDEV